MTVQLTSSIKIPSEVVHRAKSVFDLSDENIEAFLITIIHTAIENKIEQTNSEVFTKEEADQFEDELSGLGYI